MLFSHARRKTRAAREAETPPANRDENVTQSGGTDSRNLRDNLLGLALGRGRAVAVVVAVVAGAYGVMWARGRSGDALAVTTPANVRADGVSSAQLFIRTAESDPPSVSFVGNSHGARIESIRRTEAGWRVRVRSGIVPGSVALRISAPGHRPAPASMEFEADAQDSAGDGTPDYLRLDSKQDQQAFRRWFVWLAEAQYFQPAAARPAEIDDCAALIRFAYREALKAHDSPWTNALGLPEIPNFDSPEKYQYPVTPLGAALFRVKPGPYGEDDPRDGTFLQFADAQTLWRYNTHFVSRDIARANPGDLLFYRRGVESPVFHGMIYVGPSAVRPDGKRYLVYHTGPIGEGPKAQAGEVRRLTVEELLRFPEAEWRPEISNPVFLGVYRWNILRRFE